MRGGGGGGKHCKGEKGDKDIIGVTVGRKK